MTSIYQKRIYLCTISCNHTAHLLLLSCLFSSPYPYIMQPKRDSQTNGLIYKHIKTQSDNRGPSNLSSSTDGRREERTNSTIEQYSRIPGQNSHSQPNQWPPLSQSLKCDDIKVPLTTLGHIIIYLWVTMKSKMCFSRNPLRPANQKFLQSQRTYSFSQKSQRHLLEISRFFFQGI